MHSSIPIFVQSLEDTYSQIYQTQKIFFINDRLKFSPKEFFCCIDYFLNSLPTFNTLCPSLPTNKYWTTTKGKLGDYTTMLMETKVLRLIPIETWCFIFYTIYPKEVSKHKPARICQDPPSHLLKQLASQQQRTLSVVLSYTICKHEFSSAMDWRRYRQTHNISSFFEEMGLTQA